MYIEPFFTSSDWLMYLDCSRTTHGLWDLYLVDASFSLASVCVRMVLLLGGGVDGRDAAVSTRPGLVGPARPPIAPEHPWRRAAEERT